MLKVDTSLLVVIDVQGRLAQIMYRRDDLFAGLIRIIEGAKVFNLPTICLEQNPQGLGPTVPEIAEHLTHVTPISKFTFNACDTTAFIDALQTAGRSQILLCGIETHICVYQTALGLLDMGLEVQVVADAVSSRTADNRQIGLDRIQAAGGKIASSEMVLFELARDARTPEFKQLLKIVK